MKRKMTYAAMVVATFLAVSPVLAADEHNTVPGLTAIGAPLALHGVDPVAFIRHGNRIEGSARYAASHDDVAYYFATEDNLEAFEQNPAKYVPQNGGFCTFGVSVGKKFDGDPRYAEVVDGRLYVFLNEQVFREFQKDKAGTIARAGDNWKRIRHTAAGEL